MNQLRAIDGYLRSRAMGAVAAYVRATRLHSSTLVLGLGGALGGLAIVRLVAYRYWWEIMVVFAVASAVGASERLARAREEQPIQLVLSLAVTALNVLGVTLGTFGLVVIAASGGGFSWNAATGALLSLVWLAFHYVVLVPPIEPPPSERTVKAPAGVNG